jgi:maltose O-acetyltransferase
MILAHDASLRNHIGFTKMQRVVIGDDVFIGARTIVLPGVRVGDGAVVAAGSVVAADVPPGAVFGGVPAKAITTVENLIARWQPLVSEGVNYGPGWKRFIQTETGQSEFRASFGDCAGWVD